MFISSNALKDNPLVLIDINVRSQQKNTAALSRRTSNIPKPSLVILDINLEVIERSY